MAEQRAVLNILISISSKIAVEEKALCLIEAQLKYLLILCKLIVFLVANLFAERVPLSPPRKDYPNTAVSKSGIRIVFILPKEGTL